jgi:hypothetical protein
MVAPNQNSTQSSGPTRAKTCVHAVKRYRSARRQRLQSAIDQTWADIATLKKNKTSAPGFRKPQI